MTHARMMFVLFWSMGHVALAAANEPTWLFEYQGAKGAPQWESKGSPKAEIVKDGLHLRDESDADEGFYRTPLKLDGDQEIVVEATIKIGKTTGILAKTKPGSVSIWPWRDGAPIGLLVSDGRHHEGLVFYADKVTTFTDRFIQMDTTKDFHTYRLVIRGNDMSIVVDGVEKVRGQGAFWRPSPGKEPYLQFGSTCKKGTGDAIWKSIRLGVRKASGPAASDPVKITKSDVWEITRPDLKTKPTRPYVYNVGQGKLLMSIAEGPDAIYEPYGVMLSNDEGKTWSPIKGLDETPHAPLAMARLKNGSVMGVSRWTWLEKDRSHSGRTVVWDPDLSKFTLFESRIDLPVDYQSDKVTITVERQLFEDEDGSLMMTGYTRTGPNTPEGQAVGRRYSHLLRSTDGGKHWKHVSVIGPGGEPSVIKTGPRHLAALLRAGPFKGYQQTFSDDGGATWTKTATIEEGSVSPDLLLMKNGLLACSTGRPASCLMFSLDRGKSWASHHVISDKTGFNYTAVVEVRPNRLLYVHDGGGLRALYIDVERRQGPADY